MPRIARTMIEGLPYHVTQRGNRREDIFFTEEDRKKYLEWLKEYSEKYGLQIWAYCLMTNHIHLVAVPRYKDSLEKAMRPLHTKYALHINRLRNWSGHLWQGRYYSSILDERYLWMAVRYVELNPVRAGIVQNAEDYIWSSAAAHCGNKKDYILSPGFPPEGVVENWSAWLKERAECEENEILRRNTRKGLPCGSESFVTELEKQLNRSLKFRLQGRPRKVEEGSR
jgi:putative transposase